MTTSKFSPITGGFALALVAGAFLYFRCTLLQALPLHEIQVTVQKRPDPTLVQIKLRRCNEKYERNTEAHLICVNQAFRMRRRDI